MTLYHETDIDLETRILAQGHGLIDEARLYAENESGINRWLLGFIRRMMENPDFRVQALRFIDVLPALTDDKDLVDHLLAYFKDEDLHFFSDAAGGVEQLRKLTGNRLIAIAVRKAVRRLARYYLGGEDTKAALKTAKQLREQHSLFSFDLLGEAALSDKETSHYQQQYLEILKTFSEQTRDWPAITDLDRSQNGQSPLVNLSIKPSSLSCRLRTVDPAGSIAGLVQNLRPVFRYAKDCGAALCLDMEQYEFKDIILASFKTLLMDAEFVDWPHAGIAMQAYLKDTEQDLQDLLAWTQQRGIPITVRLVRGAYWDYETITAAQFGWPCPVWEHKSQTDRNYERCVETLFSHIGTVLPAIATHNIRSLAHVMALADSLRVQAHQFEFQMLYGMSPHLIKAVTERGYRLRVYVPFGELIPGMAYLTRRLLENASSQSFQRLSMQQQALYDELKAPEDEPETKETAHHHGFHNESLHRFTEAQEREHFASALIAIEAELGQTYPLFLSNESAQHSRVIRSINPARPEQLIGEVACADIRLAEQAVQAAKQAQALWASQSMEHRSDVLLRCAELLRQRRDRFAALEVFEAGKTWQEADANITEAIDFLRFYAYQALTLDRPDASTPAGETNDHLYRPRGVGLVIPPWNFPLAILTGMLSATLVTGNTAILKPSSQTPVIAAELVKLFYEVGLPRAVLQFVPGAGGDIGDYLVQHPDIHLIAFTGSLEVGERIIQLASQRTEGQQHFKHVVAEMGGKNAIIVDSDAEPDEAIINIVESAFGYQGQKCSAASRVIVVGEHYDYFLERLKQATNSLILGNPADPATQVGPVISEAAYKDIQQAIQQGKSSAPVLVELAVPEALKGFFIGPVVFHDVPVDSPLFQEEIFGPVLSVTQADSFEQALEFANHCHYALTGGVYSRNPAHIELSRQQLQAGNIYINRKITRAFVERQPFGGFKLSGLGSKAGGRDYLLQFTNPITITENTMRRGYAPPAPES